MATKCVVAIIQAEIAPDLRSGLELTAELARQAGRSEAELIIFPETWIPGYLKAQTATVVFDPSRATIDDLRAAVQLAGYNPESEAIVEG